MLWPTKPGVHSIPAMHTTYRHLEQWEPQHSTLRDSWLYVTGQTEPRYPMPAPCIDVEFSGYAVAILNLTDGYAIEYLPDQQPERMSIVEID